MFQATDKYCEQDSSWPKTKAGSAANGDCPPGRVGYTSRKCEASGWGNVLDYCVNEAINKLSDSMKVGYLRHYHSDPPFQFNMDNIPALSNVIVYYQ